MPLASPGMPLSRKAQKVPFKNWPPFFLITISATGPAASAISFLADAFSDAYGKGLDIDFSDDISGKTTHIGGMVHLENNHLVQNINVRYAIQANPEKLIAQLHARCEAAGFAIEHLHNDPPYYTSPSHPAVPFLLRAYQDVYGGPAEPYVMGGGNVCT